MKCTLVNITLSAQPAILCTNQQQQKQQQQQQQMVVNSVVPFHISCPESKEKWLVAILLFC